MCISLSVSSLELFYHIIMPKRKEKSSNSANSKKSKEDISDPRNKQGGGDAEPENEVNWPKKLAVSGSLGKSVSNSPK